MGHSFQRKYCLKLSPMGPVCRDSLTWIASNIATPVYWGKVSNNGYDKSVVGLVILVYKYI